LAFLGQFFQDENGKNRGLAPRGLPFQMVTGIYVHEGVASLLNDLKIGAEPDIEEAVQLAKDLYNVEIGDHGLMTYGCDPLQVRQEQEMLIEGLLRGWALQRLPYFQSEFEVIEVEQDRHTLLVENPEIDEEVEFEFKLDALLKHKETGLYYVLSNKTTGSVDYRKLTDAKTDIQGLSELWGAEKELNIKVHGVIMEYFVTGRKEIEETDGEKKWVQWNPLIRGWVNNASDEYAWRYAWDKMEGGSGRLGKGWVRTSSDVYPGGIKQWVSDLHQGKMFPDFGKYVNPLDQQFLSVEYYRNVDDLSEWLESIREQELRVGEILKVVNESEGQVFQTNLKRFFPMYRHSCNYPVRCQFFEICHGSAGNDPLMNGFEWRTPHHQMQMEGVE
jgi:hypothetical protein